MGMERVRGLQRDLRWGKPEQRLPWDSASVSHGLSNRLQASGFKLRFEVWCEVCGAETQALQGCFLLGFKGKSILSPFLVTGGCRVPWCVALAQSQSIALSHLPHPDLLPSPARTLCDYSGPTWVTQDP